MNTHGIWQNVQVFTAGPFGAIAAGKATNSFEPGEWMHVSAPVAPRQSDAEDSTATAWVMIGTIISCMAVMMAVVIATATSVS